MNSTIVKKENNEVNLKIEVSAETFEKAIQKAYTKMRGQFNIPGFRKGKAPRKVIEVRYGAAVFYDEAINELWPTVYKEAIEKHDLHPVDQPSLDLDEIVKGQDVVLKVKVTVKPEVTLGDYKGIEVEKIEYNVNDEDVEKEVEALRERNARLISVERPVKDGDTVIMDYAGFVGEEQFEGGTAEKQTLVIGSGQFIPGFEEQLVDVKIGEEVEVKVTFPEEYHAENLAGKDAVFKVTVHEVKEKELPELDDEFAKDVSEHDTLEELKAELKKKQEESAKLREKRELEDAILRKVIETVEVDIPEIMVEHKIDDMMNDFEQQLKYQGLDLDTYAKYTGASLQEMREQMKEDAYNRVKVQLTLEEIGKVEEIKVTKEEIDAEIDKIAAQYKMDVDKFKKSLNPYYYESIENDIKVRKTVELLVENTKISA